MELIWNSQETVTIPNVGTVKEGIKFSIEEDRGKDLLLRGLARVVTLPKKEFVKKEVFRIDAAPQGKE